MSHANWRILSEEKNKYNVIFDNLSPTDGKLSGDKVKPILMNSKLPVDVLGQVWELSDIDKDGFLDRDEFCVAMHLVYRALEKDPVPSSLPRDLIPPSKRKPSLPGAVAVLPTSTLPVSSSSDIISPLSTTLTPMNVNLSSPKTTPNKGKIPDSEYTRFSTIFTQKVGAEKFIAGSVARDLFMQSALPHTVLAHVWNLCDQQQLGKLTQDQFTLAMHLISQKVKGIDVPAQLPPDMLPSTMLRDSNLADSGNISDSSSSGVGDFSAVRELDALNREIEELRREKETLQSEIREKENHVRNKANEVQELQNTLDRASTSLSQLESDKDEAHTRLDELDQQQLKLDGMLADVRSKVQEETRMISDLQSKIKSRESSIAQQEEEYNKLKFELENFKKEEMQLKQTLEVSQQQLRNITKQVTEAQDEIVNVKNQISALAEQQKTVTSNIAQYDKAVAAMKSDSDVKTVPDTQKTDTTSGFHDPFKESDPFASESGFKSDPFADFDVGNLKAENSTDFKTDVFQTSSDFTASKDDPFASESKTSLFSSDPFGGSSPFSSSTASHSTTVGDAKRTETSSTEAFSAKFFDHDNSVSLFNDMENVSSQNTTNTLSADPWAAFGSSSVPDTDSNAVDLFAKDSFMPNSNTNNAISTSSIPEKNSKASKLTFPSVKDMSEEAQLAWAAEQSKKAERERKERLRLQEQKDLEYAIELSKQS